MSQTESYGERVKGRLFLASIMACLLTSLAGCVVIPLPEHDILWGPGMVGEEELSLLRQRATTREEVLLQLGQPSAAFYGDRVLVYKWTVATGLVVSYMAAESLPKTYYLIIEIGQDNEVLQWHKHIGSISSRLFSFEDAGVVFSALDEEYADLSEQWRITIDPVPELWIDLRYSAERQKNMTVHLGSFVDARDAPYYESILGTGWKGEPATYDIDAEIHLACTVSDYVKEAVASQLENSGFEVSEDHGACTLSGTIKEFKAEGITVEIEVVLDVTCTQGSRTALSRHHKIRKIDRRTLDPYVLEATLRKSIGDLQKQIADDADLMKILVGNQP